jgi:ABC-type microcin C transport system duplicated ATPase subunit YejF
MTQGEIVEAGPTERVLAKPEPAYTRRLVAASAGFWLGGSKELAAL